MMKNDAASSFLTEQETKEIEDITLRAPDVDLTVFEVFPFRTLLNPNAKSGEYNVADDDEGSANLLLSLKDAERIFVSGQQVTYSIYDTAIAWELKFSDIETSRSWGRPLDAEVISRATRKVNEKINSLAYVGDSKFGVPGILEASGLTSIAGGTVNNTGAPANEFITYFNSLPAKFRTRFPYKLVLNDSVWKQLQVIGNTTNDKSIMTQILEAIPNLSIVSPEANLDAGTALSAGGTVGLGDALLVPQDVGTIRMSIAKSPRSIQKDYEDDAEVRGKVHARIGVVEPIFPTATGKITGLDE